MAAPLIWTLNTPYDDDLPVLLYMSDCSQWAQKRGSKFAYITGETYSSDTPSSAGFMRRYDMQTGELTALTPMSGIHKQQCAGAVYDGKVYYFAGVEGANGVQFGPDVDTTRIYDIASDTWDTGAPMPGNAGGSFAVGEDRTYATAVEIGGKIYVVCGFGSGSNFALNDRLDSYDPDTDTWEQLAYHPQGCDFPSITVDKQNRIHNMGGNTDSAGGSPFDPNLNRHFAYTIATDSWEELEPIPSPDLIGGDNVEAFQAGSVFDASTNEIVVVVMQNTADTPRFNFITMKYHVPTDTWSGSAADQVWDQVDTNDIVIGNPSHGLTWGSRKGISTLEGFFYFDRGGGPYWDIALQ